MSSKKTEAAVNDQVNSISKTLEQKYQDLLALIRSLGKTAVAFSGGVDSAFLLAAAKEAPARELIALTMKRPYIAQWELEEAREIVEQLNVRQIVIEIPVDEGVRANVTNRCYLCKTSTFERFRQEMDELGFDTLVDGTNADDTGEFRPGMRATREHNVRSPLQEIGFTKEEIRIMCKKMGLPVWDKPSNTCLVTRIPYNTHVSDEDLRMIEKAEYFMIKKGFRQVRVRKHGDLARIEVEPEMVSGLLQNGAIQDLVPFMKSIGFKYVSIDLEGYTTGSMDKAILKSIQ